MDTACQAGRFPGAQQDLGTDIPDLDLFDAAAGADKDIETIDNEIQGLGPPENAMQLRVARLCMDCEELHDQQQCPLCASESFAYVSRWVPVRERRFRPRGPDSSAADQGPSQAQPAQKSRTATYGVLGLALAGVAGWWWKNRKRIEDAAERGAGELK